MVIDHYYQVTHRESKLSYQLGHFYRFFENCRADVSISALDATVSASPDFVIAHSVLYNNRNWWEYKRIVYHIFIGLFCGLWSLCIMETQSICFESFKIKLFADVLSEAIPKRTKKSFNWTDLTIAWRDQYGGSQSVRIYALFYNARGDCSCRGWLCP